MCEAVGHPVLALRRVAFGPLRLGALQPGAHRRLGQAELRKLGEPGGPPARGTEAASDLPAGATGAPRTRVSEGASDPGVGEPGRGL